MRPAPLFAIVVVLATACGKTSTGTASPDADGTGGEALAFEIVTKDAMLQPGEQVVYCYHFHTPNTDDALVRKWVSDMTAGSHHAILFLSPDDSTVPDGTLDTADCASTSSGAIPLWVYATQVAHEEEELPGDDGTGRPLAQRIPPHSAAMFQLHFLNATDGMLAAHVDLKAFGLAPGTAYTETSAYVAYQYQIKVGPGATGVTVPGSCPVPPDAKFWMLSTHSHRQSVATTISDGSNQLYRNTDWEHPGATTWMTPQTFYTFSSGMLSWSCTYDNTAPPPYCNQGGPQGACSNANTTIQQGTSAVTDEMCVAGGYYFPSSGTKFMVGVGPDSCAAL